MLLRWCRPFWLEASKVRVRQACAIFQAELLFQSRPRLEAPSLGGGAICPKGGFRDEGSVPIAKPFSLTSVKSCYPGRIVYMKLDVQNNAGLNE